MIVVLCCSKELEDPEEETVDSNWLGNHFQSGSSFSLLSTTSMLTTSFRLQYLPTLSFTNNSLSFEYLLGRHN